MNKITVVAGVCLFHRGKTLLLRNKSGDYDNGKWGPPGGHGEDGETVLATALRETKEETNFDVNVFGIVQSAKLNVSNGREYVMVFYIADINDISLLKIDPKESSDYAWANLDDIESGKYQIRSESMLKPILIKAFKSKPLPLDSFIDIDFTKPA